MRDFRNPKGFTERFTSLEELREAFDLSKIRKKTKDEDKLKAQKEKLVGTCKVCKQLLTWIDGTNVCTCKNPDCKGVKMTSINEDGSEKVWYVPVIRMLNEKGMNIAEILFS